MKIEITKEIRFVPEFNGNKTLPDTDRISVMIKNPSIQIKNRVRSDAQAVAKADTNGKISGMEITVKSDDTAVLNEMLVSIDNLSYVDGKGNEVRVVNAYDLNRAPLQLEPLRKEILDECNRILDSPQLDEKN